jgi:regulator of protease activity HflC (stomatin/prohibitin superfamily)
VGTVFERLLDLLMSASGQILPVFVVREYEAGIILRLGKFVRRARTGLNFKLPILEVSIKVSTVLETFQSADQHLTTVDGHHVSIRNVAAFRVSDAKMFILDVEDAEGVVADCLMRVAADLVGSSRYDEIQHSEFEEQLFDRVSEAADDFGIEIVTVGLLRFFKFDAMLLTQSE